MTGQALGSAVDDARRRNYAVEMAGELVAAFARNGRHHPYGLVVDAHGEPSMSRTRHQTGGTAHSSHAHSREAVADSDNGEEVQIAPVVRNPEYRVAALEAVRNLTRFSTPVTTTSVRQSHPRRRDGSALCPPQSCRDRIPVPPRQVRLKRPSRSGLDRVAPIIHRSQGMACPVTNLPNAVDGWSSSPG